MVVEKFGESYLTRSLGTEASEVKETQQDPHITRDRILELQEFPWAMGYVGDVCYNVCGIKCGKGMT